MNKIRSDHRARATASVAAHLLRTGLAATSLRQLAAAAGVSDRMLLYYFEDKTEVLSEAMAFNVASLSTSLASAIPADTALTPGAMIAAAAGLTTSDAVQPFMRLWIAIVAEAARGAAPFDAIAAEVTSGFLDWIEVRLAPLPGDNGTDARMATAAAILAMIDGLALVAVTIGDERAAKAAAHMVAIAGGGELCKD